MTTAHHLAMFPLIPVASLISASPSTPGETGHGEGFSFERTAMGRAKTFFYRFAGRAIPRQGLVYLTSEDGYFSRIQGDRTQVIALWDPQAEGFRILVNYNQANGFMALYKKLVEMPIEQAIEQLVTQKKEEQALAEKMSSINIDDLF